MARKSGAAELLLEPSWLPPPLPLSLLRLLLLLVRGCCVLFAATDDEAPPGRAWRLLDRGATVVVWTAAAVRVLAGSAARAFGVGAGGVSRCILLCTVGLAATCSCLCW